MPVNMLDRIRIKNFKSLKNTEINLAKNTFLIGMNGVGKTSILQAIDFLSVISLKEEEGSVAKWLKSRGWNKKDLTFYGSKKSLIEFEVEFKIGKNKYLWEIAFNSNTLRCTRENILRYDDSKEVYSQLFKVDSGEYIIYSDINYLKPIKRQKIDFEYTGSILSKLKSDLLGTELNTIYKFFNKIRSAELLSPLLMKKRAREAIDGIGLGGEKLSAFVNMLSSEKKEELQKVLKDFFPYIESFETKSLRSGWKSLSLVENQNHKLIKTDSMHLSDGILRILAILSQLLTTESVLVFDEIEDGINQEFVEKLVDTLLLSVHQTIVATHSPLLLNYLEDDIAKESILFVYKTEDGATMVENFFYVIDKYQDISKHEYDLFGAGEIMQRVNLLELTTKLLKKG